MVGPTPESWAIRPSQAEAFEVVPGLWQLRLPLPWNEIVSVNAFAVARDDGVMLVDCGTAGHKSCWDALVATLGEAGYSIADVRALVATHAHSDHIGLAAGVLEESGCDFWMHPDHGHFYDVMHDPEGFEQARARRATQEGVPAEIVRHYADVSEETDAVLAPVGPDRQLVEGVELPSALGTWTALETPGHAPSHVCLHQRERGILLVGDLVSAVFAPYFDYGYTPDPVAEFIASLERLADMNLVELALPGHGRPIRDVQPIIAEHLRGCDERLAATAAAVREGPAGAYGLTERIFGEPPNHTIGVWQFVEVACYLKHLRNLGRVVREHDETGRFRYRRAGGRALENALAE